MDFERQRASPCPPSIIHHSSRCILHCAKQPNRSHFGYIPLPDIYEDQRDLRNGATRVHYRQFPSVRSLTIAVGSETQLTVAPRSSLQNYYVNTLQTLLTRLQSSKTETFALRFVRFYHFVSARDDKELGADFFISIAEQVQSGYDNFLP